MFYVRGQHMLKRIIPNNTTLFNRQRLLTEYTQLQPIDGDWYGFDKGNSKTGVFNCHGENVLVWNLPPVVCCPGASKCLGYCYNADDKTDKYPIDKWCVNWFWTIHKPQETYINLDRQIKSISRPVIRIHSSGDFYSQEYIRMWIELISSNPQSKFWAYTRSWKIPELSILLEQLHDLDNMQLFASLDGDAELSVPKGWRYCLVGTLEKDVRFFNCPEQYNSTGLFCVNCRVCYLKGNENIYFTMH